MSTKNQRKRGKLIVISGPSGVGKSTICRHLCERLPAEFSVSVTTRRPRVGEENDRDYRYLSRDAFEKLRKDDALLEWAEVYGHFYGTPLQSVEQVVEDGRIIILEIDIQGCKQVRKKYPEAVTIFLLPPTPTEQKRRIEGRNTDDAEVIRKRLSKADGEIRFAMDSQCYDEFLVNDDVNETVNRIIRRVNDSSGDQ